MEFAEFYEAGEIVLVEYDVVAVKPGHGLARGHYRLRMQLMLIGLLGLLLAVAGVTGLKAMLSFIFSAMVLWKFLGDVALGCQLSGRIIEVDQIAIHIGNTLFVC